ncbi:tannase/feruloyl esterase family alpha/beta hydrolase [Frateuria aurantia]
MITPWSDSTAHADESAPLSVIRPVAACESLSHADLAAVVGAVVHDQKAEVLQTEKGPFCKVTGTIAPAVAFEVDLPSEHWTQRFLLGGCGGLCGMTRVGVSNASTCAPALNGEMIMAGTDMGHSGPMMGLAQGAFGEDPQARIDFAYRANHVTTLAAKALSRAYYGQNPRYSYFVGCSDGGREALMEAQRYPDDFNGISAGAPAAMFTIQNSFYHAWNVRGNQRADGTNILLQDRVAILHQAVIDHCDTLSGVHDGILEDPRACHFDPSWVRCPPEQADHSHCLTAEETAAAERLYRGATDVSGRSYIVGGPLPGSELQWALPASATGESMSQGIAASAIAYVISPQVDTAATDLSRFRFDAASFARMSTLAPLYNAENTNLRPFKNHGGRLILWHGLADQSISPLTTIAYYQGVQKELGVQATQQFVRFYLIPGVGHCGNGEGFPQVDFLSPLMTWTETGAAPGALDAGRPVARKGHRHGMPDFAHMPPPGAHGMPPMDGPPPAGGLPPMQGMAARGGQGPAMGGQIHQPIMPSQPFATAASPTTATRPVYPYPYIAKYKGQGDPNDAASYIAVKSPVVVPMSFASASMALIGPDNQREYEVKDGKLVVIGR